MIAASGTSWPGIGVCLALSLLFGLWSLIVAIAATKGDQGYADWIPAFAFSLVSAGCLGAAVVAAAPR